MSEEKKESFWRRTFPRYLVGVGACGAFATFLVYAVLDIREKNLERNSKLGEVSLIQDKLDDILDSDNDGYYEKKVLHELGALGGYGPRRYGRVIVYAPHKSHRIRWLINRDDIFSGRDKVCSDQEVLYIPLEKAREFLESKNE